MNFIPNNKLNNISGGNAVEDLCQKPGVNFLLLFAKPGVKKLMENKEFTNKLSSVDINNTSEIKKLFGGYGVQLTDSQVNNALKLLKPFI